MLFSQDVHNAYNSTFIELELTSILKCMDITIRNTKIKQIIFKQFANVVSH